MKCHTDRNLETGPGVWTLLLTISKKLGETKAHHDARYNQESKDLTKFNRILKSKAYMGHSPKEKPKSKSLSQG